MTMMSPLLLQKLQQNNIKQQPENSSHHERVYRDLVNQANSVKPNQAKAKLIKEGPITSAISSIKDMGSDITNFHKAVTKGQSNDNKLGRLNDLGLKAGALLIASYLAAHSKTKTEAVMRFVGGGAFLASMKLWPKLFINLPARLVHGFDIGQRYVSAQGDKKDFFLDNQFLPWDAYSDEELRKIGKRTGIDFDSENGKEKIQRKMQKTALQNRTLWMATAGFATPLMTALFCDKVEPHIKNGIINRNFRSFKDRLHSNKLLEEIQNAPIKNQTPIEIGSVPNFEEIAKKIMLDAKSIGITGDEAKPLFEDKGNLTTVKQAVENLFNKTATIEMPKDSLVKSLEQLFGEYKQDLFAVTKEEIQGLVGTLSEKPTIQELKDAIQNNSTFALDDSILKKYFDSLISSETKIINTDNFKKTINDFQNSTLAVAKARLKAYLDSVNKAIGNRAESKATQEITGSLKGIMDAFGKNPKLLKALKENDSDFARLAMQAFFKGEKEYKEFLQVFSTLEEALAQMNKINKSSPESQQRLANSLKGILETFEENPKLSKALKEGNQTVAQDAINAFSKGSGRYRDFLNELLNAPEKEIIQTVNQTAKGQAAKAGEIIVEDLSEIKSRINQPIRKLFETAPMKKAKLIVNRFKSASKNATASFKQTYSQGTNLQDKEVLDKTFNGLSSILTNLRPRVNEDCKELYNAVLGDRSSSIFGSILPNYLEAQKANLTSFVSRPAICANFEKRLKEGKIVVEGFGKLNAPENKKLLQVARSIIYQGNQSLFENDADLGRIFANRGDVFAKLKQALFNEEAFRSEPQIVQTAAKELLSQEGKKTTKYLRNLDYAQQIKNAATNLYNNKAWKRIFVPMALVLTGVTLLCQPFFGKIKKEYNENGGIK